MSCFTECLIPTDECKKNFTFVLYDSCNVYLGHLDLLNSKTGIYKYNGYSEPLHICDVDKLISSICYDSQNMCYWGSEYSSSDTIYQLDLEFKVIKTIVLKIPHGFHECIKAVSMDCQHNQLIITYTWHICIFSITGEYIKEEDKDCSDTSYIACNGVSPYLGKILHHDKDFLFSITVKDKVVYREKIPTDLLPLSMSYRYQEEESCLAFYILCVNQSAHNSLLTLTVPSSCLCESPCTCNDTSSCEKTSDCSCLIQSIALVETSIAHILNSEAEKIQKILHCSDNFCEIIKVNESVLKVLQQTVMLEQLLVMKLNSCHINCDDHIDQCLDSLCKESCTS